MSFDKHPHQKSRIAKLKILLEARNIDEASLDFFIILKFGVVYLYI